MSEEIRNLMQTYRRGLNEAEVDLAKTVYADDAIFIGQPFLTATGKEKNVALYTDFFRSSTSTFSSTSRKWS